MKKALYVVLFAAATAASSCQTNTVGLACTTDAECDRGQSCFSVNLGFPGGFCSKGCIREGATMDCPGGTICTSTTNSGGIVTLFCSTICTSDTECRGGQYACNGVTQSNLKACRP